MKKITVENYSKDPYYSRVVNAAAELLTRYGYVSPIMLFQEMELLSEKDVESWRRGSISYLEKAIRCNLSKASRILRILRFHAHDLNLMPSRTDYKRKTASGCIPLRFSKSGQAKLEEVYSTHFVSQRLRTAKMPLEATAKKRAAPQGRVMRLSTIRK